MRYFLFLWTLSVFIIPASVNASTLLPEFYGVYAIDKGKLTELTENWEEKPELSKLAKFIVFDKGISQKIQSLKLVKMVYVRNYIYRASKEVQKNEEYHLIKDKKRSIDFRTKPVKGEDEMVYVVPRNPLVPGIYAMISGDSSDGSKKHFAVDIKTHRKNRDSGSDCADMSFNNAFSQVIEGAGSLQPCGRDTSTKKLTKNTSKSSIQSAKPSIQSALILTPSKHDKIEKERVMRLEKISDNTDSGQMLEVYKNTEFKPFIHSVVNGNKQDVVNSYKELINTTEDADKFSLVTRVIPYPFEKVWEAVQRLVKENDEDINISFHVKKLSLGLLATSLTRHGFFGARYNKYYIFAEKIEENKTKISLKTFSYYLYTGEGSNWNNKNLMPNDKSEIDKLNDNFFLGLRNL